MRVKKNLKFIDGASKCITASSVGFRKREIATNFWLITVSRLWVVISTSTASRGSETIYEKSNDQWVNVTRRCWTSILPWLRWESTSGLGSRSGSWWTGSCGRWWIRSWSWRWGAATGSWRWRAATGSWTGWWTLTAGSVGYSCKNRKFNLVLNLLSAFKVTRGISSLKLCQSFQVGLWKGNGER